MNHSEGIKLSQLKNRNDIDVFFGGEDDTTIYYYRPSTEEKKMIDVKNEFSYGLKKEMVGTIIFTASTVAALATYYVGFGLMAVAATFLTGSTIKLLLNRNSLR
jgi:hypothetical protein